MLPPNRETSLLVENSKSKSCGEAMESAGIRCHQTQISITDSFENYICWISNSDRSCQLIKVNSNEFYYCAI